MYSETLPKESEILPKESDFERIQEESADAIDRLEERSNPSDMLELQRNGKHFNSQREMNTIFKDSISTGSFMSIPKVLEQ